MGKTAREAALEALERCRRDRAWSGATIDGVIKKYGLDGRDAALASRLCLGVLQNAALCDYAAGLWLSGPASRLEPKLRDILRLGAYQLLFLDKIPARAAVNESVALCRAAGLDRAAGLVNAVLRRLAENRDALPEPPGKGTAEYLSVRYSHPLWLVRALLDENGYEFTEAFLAENNKPARLCLQVNRLKIQPRDMERALERAGLEYAVFPELPGCLELPGGNPAELPGWEEGLFYVQDRAARAAVELAGPRPGMKVLDACAAPGGKAFAAAIAMEDRGEILAWDIHEKKLSLVRAGAARLGVSIIRAQARDARVPDASLTGAFDLVLADLPCSGLGVIGKRPEIRNKTAEEIAPLPALQASILDNLAAFVRPGGLLLYSTCTVLQRENAGQAAAFLARHPDFAPEDAALGPVRSENGMAAFWPNTDGTDGFFAARLRKKA